MPIRLCSEARCAEQVSYRGRCKTHARTRERNTNRAGHDIYRTRRWRLLRRQVLSEQPLCPGVLGDTCDVLAEHVHHLKDIRNGGDPWARTNLQALCASCHGRITRMEQATQ